MVRDVMLFLVVLTVIDVIGDTVVVLRSRDKLAGSLLPVIDVVVMSILLFVWL